MKLIRNYIILCAFILTGMILPSYFLSYNVYETYVPGTGMIIAELTAYIMGRIFFYWILPITAFKMFKNFIASAVLKQQQSLQSSKS